ncbi:MAG: putative rane protein [Firmicutes bacterium]|nr:putative rane protein [Bacillota bacterium]
MYLEIYPDIVFILNFCIDFILLFLVKSVNRKRSNLLRLCGGAMLGGLFAVLISLLPWINSGSDFIFSSFYIKGISILIKLIAIPLMLVISFGKLKWADMLKQGISLCLITYIVGGLMNSIYYDTKLRLDMLKFGDTILLSNISWTFVAIGMVIVVVLSVGLIFLMNLYRRKEKEIYAVELSLEGRSIRTKGLYDTGNCLYDPLYHKPVIVIERSVMEELLSKEFLDEFDNTKNYLMGLDESEEMAATLEQSPIAKKLLLRLRIIPYSSIGKAQGMMYGLMLDQLVIHMGKETICCQRVTAAISENSLSPKEEYHVILHKEL